MTVSGRSVILFLGGFALIFGVALYYFQNYAYYAQITPGTPGAEIRLTSLESGRAEAVPAEDFQGIDAETSPLKYRACFTLPLSLPMLSETYRIVDDAEPLVAPGWFDCFDAGEIEAGLAAGDAVAFMGEENMRYGVDRLVVVFSDGRAFAWNRINTCGEDVFEGKPAPEGCPPLPERP